MTRTAFAAWSLALTPLLTLMLATGSLADPISFSASGTVTASNEPDPSLHADLNAPTLFSDTAPDGSTRQYIRLGHVNVIPSNGFDGVQFPNYHNAPFDIRIEFNNAGLPNLEFKGSISGVKIGNSTIGDEGLITSITSSAPELNFALPAPFANMLAHPQGAAIGIADYDWNLTNLGVYAVYEPLAVPEPTTLIVMAAGIVALAVRRCVRRKR